MVFFLGSELVPNENIVLLSVLPKFFKPIGTSKNRKDVSHLALFVEIHCSLLFIAHVKGHFFIHTRSSLLVSGKACCVGSALVGSKPPVGICQSFASRVTVGGAVGQRHLGPILCHFPEGRRNVTFCILPCEVKGSNCGTWVQ